MKLLLLLVSTLISFHAWSFEYQIDQASLLNPSPLQIYKISKTLSANGYHSMSDMNLTQAGFAFDRVFVSHKWQSGIVLKAGLKVPENLRGKVLEDVKLGVQILHFEIENTPYMVMGMDMTGGEFREAFKPWISSGDASTKWAWMIPKAHAVTCMTGQPTYHRSLKEVDNDVILRAIGKCGADVLGGAVSSVSSTWSFFKRLATEPRKLWQETKQSFVELKDFVLNMGTELSAAFASFKQLTTEEKTEMACIMAGQVLGTVGQALVGGAALAKLGPQLLVMLKKGVFYLHKGAELAAKGVQLPSKSFLAREAMACAL